MLADNHRRREGALFDIAAIAFSITVIVASVYIVNTASMRYRVAGLSVATASTVPAPTARPSSSR